MNAADVWLDGNLLREGMRNDMMRLSGEPEKERMMTVLDRIMDSIKWTVIEFLVRRNILAVVPVRAYSRRK